MIDVEGSYLCAHPSGQEILRLWIDHAVFLGRKVYAVFGVIGIAMYLGDLANKVFKDSLLFPFALSLIGIAVIAAGLLYYRHQDRITAWLEARMPDVARSLRPLHMR